MPWLGAMGWLSSARSAEWTPKNIAGLNLWLDADDLSGADGDAVTSWISKEGSSYNFAQTSTKCPLLKKAANGINGHNTVLFDGTNDVLVCSDTISSVTQGTIFVVYSLSATPKSDQGLFCTADQASATRFLILYGFKTTNTGSLTLLQRDNDTMDTMTPATIAAVSTPYFVSCKSDGAVYIIRTNGINESLTATTGANGGDWLGDTSARDNFTIGGSKTTGEGDFLKGSVSEVIMYDTGLSDTNLKLVESYLGNKYNITLPNYRLGALTIATDSVDVDSAGNIYAGYINIIKKSTNGGATWTNIFTIPNSPILVRRVFVDSRDYIYVSGWIADASSVAGSLWRSIDGGANFTEVIDTDNGCCVWGIDEDSLGNIYAGEYSSGLSGTTQIWKSSDDGATWVQKFTYGVSGANVYHVHDVRIDPANDYIYACCGDAYNALLRSRDAGETWDVVRGNTDPKFLAMTACSDYMYFGTDHTDNGIFKLDDDGTAPQTLTLEYDLPTGSDDYLFDAAHYNGKIVFLSYSKSSELRNLWYYDGASWSSIRTEPATGGSGFYSISRRPINGVFYISRFYNSTVRLSCLTLDMSI